MIGHPQPANQDRGSFFSRGLVARLPVSALLLLALTGCLSKRAAYDIPPVPLTPQFKNSLPEKAADKPVSPEKSLNPPASAEDASLVEWWRYFGNRELDGLIDRGLANNPDVRIATIRLAQAKTRADQADAGLLPSVSMPGVVARQAPGGSVGTVPTGTSARAPQTSIQGSLRGDYRLDIWGEQTALAESTQMQLWRAAFERDNVQRTVTASIASNYVEYAALNDRLRLAQETERALSDTLRTLEKRLEMGDATVGDLEQQKAVVFGLRAAIPGMQQQREDAMNTLAFMVGSLPGGLSLSDQGLESLTVPEVVPGLPSALLLRRPDVRVVEARLLSADADIDVARARILPPVDLAAQAGYSSNTLAQLFLPKAFFWSTVASLTASIFDAGKRENEKKYTESMREELVETYVRTIYQAMREVEGSLATIRLAGKRMDSQRDAAQAARRAWEINTKVYAMGGADIMSLLESERTFLRYQDDYQRAQMENYRGYIGLFQALGGGVKPGAPLPGKGNRPQAGRAGSVSSAAVNPSDRGVSVEGVNWQNADGQLEPFWQIELPGLYHRATVGAAWRDLRERYPEMMAGRILRPRLSGRIEEGADGQEAWYRLFVAKFVAAAEAHAFCDRLLANQERCQVVYSRPGEEPRVEPRPADAVQPAPLPAPQPVQSAEALPPPAVDVEKQAEMPLDPPPSVPALPVVRDEEKSPPQDEGKGAVAYTIQLGAFSNPENAAIASTIWQFRGYEVYVSESRGSDGRNWYAVRSGLYSQRREGAVAAQLIRRKEDAPAVVVPTTLDKDGKLLRMDVEPLLAQRLKVEAPVLPEPPERPVMAEPETPLASTRPESPSGKAKPAFAVQLGAFSTRENARVSLDFWRAHGLVDAYLDSVTDVAGRGWFAVRSGQFASRREASALALQLGRKENVSALVVPLKNRPPAAVDPEKQDEMPLPAPLPATSLSEPEPLPELAVEPPVAAKPAIRFSLQIGAFASIENAAKAYAEWQARGYAPYVCETDDLKGNLRFAVRAGEFADKREAQQMLRTMQRQESLRVLMVPALLDAQGAVRKIDVTPLLPNPALDLPSSAELSANDVR